MYLHPTYPETTAAGAVARRRLRHTATGSTIDRQWDLLASTGRYEIQAQNRAAKAA
jgi:hypothetical protein